jgi:hypothetical protein
MLFISILPLTGLGTWRALDQNTTLSCMDFLPTGVGLVGISGPASSVAKWDLHGSENGVLIPSNPGDQILSVRAIDSSTGWATIASEGLYYTSSKLWGLNTWKLVLGGNNLKLLYATKSQIFLTDGSTLRVSTNLTTFNPCTGILVGDTVNAVASVGNQVFIATAGDHVYRSVNGGGAWSMMDTVTSSYSVFFDSVAKTIFIGGDTVRMSTDYGVTWTGVITPVIAILSGQVVGVHDCSGAFYVTTFISNILDLEHNFILRSQDHGQSFQEVGRAYNATIHFSEGLAFDRGSILYWLDPVDGWLSITMDGVDGSLPASLSPDLHLAPDSSIVSDACTHQLTPFNVTIGYGECVPLQVDSLKEISGIGTVSFTSFKVTFSATASATMQFAYEARANGIDTIHLRLWFHNTETMLAESRDFTVVAMGVSDPAKLSVNKQTVSFGQVKVDSSKLLTFTIRNSGCLDLRVDSIVSSNPTLFPIDQHVYPLVLKSGDSLPVKVTFMPTDVGEQVEAVEYGTSAGHGFVTLDGIGATTVVQGVDPSLSSNQIAIYPNPAHDFITVQSNSGIRQVTIHDLLGRVAMETSYESPAHVQLDLRDLPNGTYLIAVDHNRPIPILLLR